MTWKFYDLKIVLWVLIGIPLIASTNIDCGGRSFHCLNTTHFRICVDLGGGLSTTVDDFVIPCPSPTVCSHSNRFECEFPPSARIPLAVPITLTSATNELESATTLAWEEIVVPTTLSFDTSVGYLELQNNTIVSTESQLVEVTSPTSVTSISETETVTEIIPIPNTTFKPQIITIEDILVTNNTILLNGTDTVVDVSINKTTVTPEVTGNKTQANISASNITENKINETTVNPKIEVIVSNATEANISPSNVIDNNVEETTANSQMEVVTSTAFASNTNILNISENSINERKAITAVEAVNRTMTGTNNTVTSNVNENNFVTKMYETSTDINAEIGDTREANLNINNKTSSVVENITMDTSVTLGIPITTAESGKSASRVDDMVTKVSTTPKITKTAETMNTISVTTIYPKITVHNNATVLIHDSVIPEEINRKKATEVIDSITTAVPEMVNTDVNATLVEEVIATTNVINIDITSTLPSVQYNQSFVTESSSYSTNINETTIVTPSPGTVSDTISKASSLIEDFVTQNPIFSVNTESNAQKTASTTLQATEIVSNTDDNSILNLKTPTEESTTIVVYNKNVADKVKEDINKINATTTISVPITTQKIDVVTLDSNNLVGEILVTTTISNVNTDSNVKESTEASNTIDINSTTNTPVQNSLTSTTVPDLKTISNVTENIDVFDVPKILHNIDTDATINSTILIEELTSPTISEANITNTSASLNSNDVNISSTISPNFLTTDTSELIKLTEIKNETTTPSSVSEIDLITTEHKLRENTDTFETTINNFSPLLDTNTGNNDTVAVENKKAADLSLNDNTVTTTTDNIFEIQTSTSELDIIEFTTESSQNFSPDYPSTFSELFGDPTTTNTKLNMNDRQLYFETSTSYVLPTQLIQNIAGNSHNIPKVISLYKPNVSPTTDDTTNAATDNITSTMEVVDLPPTVSVTEHSTTDALRTEAQLKRGSGNMIDKEDTSITPNSIVVYITTSQNEILKTADNANDFGNIANQADISPISNYLSTESSLLDDATTHIITTPPSASEVQTPNTSSYNLPTVKESTILTTASILESDINATGIEIANESTDEVNTLYSNTNSTERTSTMSIILTPKGNSVAPDAMMSTETLESTTQNNKALYDTDVPEVQTISTVKDNNLLINTQLFNVPTTTRTLEISVNVNTESALNKPHLINTDINFHSIAPSTEGNVISSLPPSGNDLVINNKSPNNDKVTTAGNVDKSTLSANLQINKLNTNDATKTQTDLLNTTLTKGTEINLETGNTFIARSQTDELLTESCTTTECVRNSNLQSLNSQNNVNSEHGVANQPETETSTQAMTYVYNITPSVQGTLKSEKPQLGTTEILEVKKTNIPVQDLTNNFLTTDLREKPTTIGSIVASEALLPAIIAVSNHDAIISATSSPAMVSAGSNINNDSLSTNIAARETAIVQENVSSDTLRFINTIAPETIPAVKHENKNSILTVTNSTSSPRNGREFNNLTNTLENVPFNTHEASANHHLITSEPVATTDWPADAEQFYISQTDKDLPQSTSSMKVSPAAISNPDATIPVESSINTDQIVLTPKTVTWQRPTVQKDISSGVQRSTNNDALEIIPLTQNENQVTISANVANKSTASPNNGTHISNITNPLENVVLNMKDESVSDNRTMSAANVTTPPAGISTSTENSSSMIQSTGPLSVTSSNATNNLTPLNVNSSNVSVLPDKVKIVPQLPNINSDVINQHDKKSTIAETIPNTGILKVPISISENTQNTDKVVNEVKNAVKDSKRHPPPESVKNNFNNISLSMQSVSTLSITTTDVKLNVTETTFTNSSVEFHTLVSKTNVNAQPSTDGNTKSLPNSVVAKTSPLNGDSNLSKNDITHIPVVVIEREKVNKNHNVNIELSFVQNSSYPLTKTATKSHTTTATEAAVRRTQTTGSTIGSTHPVVTTGQLSILNTVKVDVERTNVEKNLNFDCENRSRGRYSDNKDCRKFYVCIGLRQPIEGLCPVNTVFSEVKKQCTKNLSYCIRQNQFKCVTNGRFSDVLEQNVYYICVKNHREEFVRFKFQCQNGYRLNKKTVRCVEDETEPSNKSISNESDATVEKSSSSNNRDYSKTYDSNHSTNENAKDNVLKTVKDKSNSERRKGNEDFECEEEGKFPDPKSCRKYYVCSKSNRSEEYRQRRKKCNSDEVFHKDKKKCVDADSFECS